MPVDGEVTCPRCGTRMEFRVEMEFGDSGGERRIYYYYKCPRCGLRRADHTVHVRRVDGRIVLEAYDYAVARAAGAARH